MHVSLTWLAELVDIPAGVTPAEIAERLTAAGLEVEAVEDLAAPLAGVKVARVAAVEKHPQADRLNVCSVDAGGAPITVVCGASNVAAGAWVCFAPSGTVLPGNKKIETAAIRGVTSNGMLCSAQELGLPWTTDGLLLLQEGDRGVSVGAPVAPALGRDDIVLTLGITPNRPDALSHLGIARELAAALKIRMRPLVPTCAERGGPIDDLVTVTIEDVDGCPRYAARVIEGVTPGPSPRWLQARLAACGVRSINNIVDVTNLVMMERGIPLHAFDADKLGKDKNRAAVVVRKARAGEALLTLDGKERALEDGDLVIADPERAIALAGVMGGQDTEVTAATTRVLLECAYFAPGRVRKTARRLGLHSEASHRFERGCDPNGVGASLDRAAALIAELAASGPASASAGGRVARGIVDAYPKKIPPAVVSLRPKRAAQVLGVSAKLVDEASCSKLLLSLGLEVDGREAEALRFRVPTFRPDLTREIDLIEELLRLIGSDQVPATLPARASEGEGLFDERRHRTLNVARTALEAAGFDEAKNIAFVSPSALDPFDGGDQPSRIRLQNPLGEEMSVMRKSLLPGLLHNAATNHRRNNLDVLLYETATVFLGKNPGGKAPRIDAPDGPPGGDAWAREVVRLSGVALGETGVTAFDRRPTAVDFFDMKGWLEQVLEALGVPCGLSGSAVSFVPADDRYPFLHPRARAEVWVRAPRAGNHGVGNGTAQANEVVKHWIGVVGEVHPDLVEKLELKSRAVAFELDADALTRVARDRPRARPLPRFPAVRRDFALVVDAALPAAELCARLADNGAVRAILEKIDVFDVYRGDQVPAGKKSVAVALVLRAGDRTLTDEEVVRATAVLLDDARAHFRADVRA